MNTYSILFLSTFFLISSLHASSPQAQANLAGAQLAKATAGATRWKTLPPIAERGAGAAQVAGSPSVTPKLATPEQAPAAAAAASNEAVPTEERPPVELTNAVLGGVLIPTVVLNWKNGTDQTLLNYLRSRDPHVVLKTDKPEAQKIIASAVANFESRADYEQKMKDIKEFMTLVKRDGIVLDRSSRRSLRAMLKQNEDKQETELLGEYDKQVETLRKAYQEKTDDMKRTEAARHVTYQEDSDNEEEVRRYKPTDKLMAFPTADLITKARIGSQK